MDARDFFPAYTTAIYKTAALGFTLTHLPNDLSLFSKRAFAIITAHNPHSQPLTKEENSIRHLELQAFLQDRQFEIEISTGESPDGSWSEEGFLIFDITLSEALEIGTIFEQHAILYGQDNRVALAWCEDQRLEWFFLEVMGDGC